MMRALLVLLFAAVAHCRLAPLYNVEPSIPGQYIVNLEDDVNVADFAATMKNGIVRNTIQGIINAVVLTLDDDLLEKVRGMSGVKFVEEDGLATVLDNRGASYFWGLDRIDEGTCSPSFDGRININGDGSNANIYIIDTGIRYTHNEFGGRAKLFYDYQGSDGSDCHSHGTHCAGTAAGSNSGVASNANIFSVRVMSCSGTGANSDIIDGLNEVRDDSRSRKIASMSIGGGYSPTLNAAVTSAYNAGVVVVVAAGNNGGIACNYSPASAPEAITVGATNVTDDHHDCRASFSNYGSCVDIFAPGEDILSAYYGADSYYAYMSGTSMACPHVAGAAAILLGNDGSLSPSSVASSLVSNATSGCICDRGSGSPDLLLYVP